MSRIGKYPVQLPQGVSVQMNGQDITVKGPKGQLQRRLNDNVAVAVEGESVAVSPRNETRAARSIWATTRTVIANMVTGVSQGFTKSLEINGVGYRAAMQGSTLVLQLGYSHEIKFPVPQGVQITVEKPTALSISGIDKQQVGQVAAEIRGFRAPEPYKGKGVRYAGERISMKEGKKK